MVLTSHHRAVRQLPGCKHEVVVCANHARSSLQSLTEQRRSCRMVTSIQNVAGGPTAATRRGCEALAQLVAKHVLLPTACLVLTLQVPLQAAALEGLASPSFAPSLSSSSREEETFENIPGQLSSSGDGENLRLGSLLQGSKHKEVEKCTRKCMPACIRGGEGAPGLGPMSMRKEVVVFKEGFRSRQYCLSECTQVCYLSIQGPLPAQPGK